MGNSCILNMVHRIRHRINFFFVLFFFFSLSGVLLGRLTWWSVIKYSKSDLSLRKKDQGTILMVEDLFEPNKLFKRKFIAGNIVCEMFLEVKPMLRVYNNIFLPLMSQSTAILVITFSISITNIICDTAYNSVFLTLLFFCYNCILKARLKIKETVSFPCSIFP